MSVSNFAGSLIIVFGSVLALIFGKPLLFPFLFALLIYFLIRAIHRFIDRNKFVREKIPSWTKSLISTVFIFSLLGFTIQMLIVNSQHLARTFSNYQENIDEAMRKLSELTGMNVGAKITESIEQFEISEVINPILNSLTGIMGSFMMALFYLLFLFIEQSNFKAKLHVIFKRQEKYDDIKQLLYNIEHSITHYIGLKTLISFISATIAFIVMLIAGIDSPLLWSFIVFCMNFIPVIGPFLVAILPATFALIQYGDFNVPLIIFFVLGTIQTLIGNVLEPKLMGDSLNISPLVALLSLAFWGAIWGITGMIVSVPITVILIILLAHFPKTRSLAILLSQNGKV